MSTLATPNASRPKKTLSFREPGARIGTRSWKLELDPSEYYPDDPGNGTPLLVIAPNDETSTLYCTLGEGVISGDDQPVPDAVMAWLESVQDEAEAYVYAE